MIEISVNDIQVRKKDRIIIQTINEIVLTHFKNAPLKKKEIRIFFKEDEEYYSYLGFEKPYRNLVVTDGFYDREYQEIFIRLGSKSIIRTYIHELGHYFDYNLKMENDEEDIKIGSAFTRKIYKDIPFEDQVTKDVNQMPAYTLLHVASGNRYIFNADEIFARMFEAFVWEKLGRKYFTPDLYIYTPKLFLFLNEWLSKNKESFWYKKLQKIHFYLLNRSINRRKAHDPFKEDRFSKYVLDLLAYS